MVGSYASGADAVALQGDGKIVAAGYSINLLQQGFVDQYKEGFAVARYKPDGSLDRSFARDGKVTTFFRSDEVVDVSDLALQPDGKIVAVGTAEEVGARSDFALVRYNANGSLDRSFGGDGKVRTVVAPEPGGDAEAVALQPDGRIVVVGRSIPPRDALVRYDPDGSLDTSFGGDGTLIGRAGLEGIDDVALQRDGKIVITAVEGAGTEIDVLVLARYRADGSLDPSFDGDGKVMATIDLLPDLDDSRLVIQPDGKIVALASQFLDDRVALVRYKANGSLDPSFDGDGKVTTTLSQAEVPYDIALQADGKIVVAGDGFALARYNTDGSLDTSFGEGGKVTTKIGRTPQANAVALQADGRIVVAGEGFPPGVHGVFTLARYNPNGSLDASFSSVSECVVPKLVGLSLARARARIVAAQCRTGQFSRRYSAKPRGRVIAQRPTAGRRVPAKAPVRLVVSRGPKPDGMARPHRRK